MDFGKSLDLHFAAQKWKEFMNSVSLIELIE